MSIARFILRSNTGSGVLSSPAVAIDGLQTCSSSENVNAAAIKKFKATHEIGDILKFSRIKYFAVWLNSAQKQIFADKIFVVERESRKVHTYVYNKY